MFTVLFDALHAGYYRNRGHEHYASALEVIAALDYTIQDQKNRGVKVMFGCGDGTVPGPNECIFTIFDGNTMVAVREGYEGWKAHHLWVHESRKKMQEALEIKKENPCVSPLDIEKVIGIT